MNELSTGLKTHVIVTMQGNHHFISAERNQALKNSSLDKMFNIADGSAIKVSSISEILPIAKYYELYPEKQAKNYHQPYSQLPGNVFTRAAKNGRERFLIGLRRVAPNSALLRDIKGGKTVRKANTYNPKFRLEKERNGETTSFTFKPITKKR